MTSEVWTWQDGSTEFDNLRVATMDQDGSVILVGGYGSPNQTWSATKLDSNGTFVWEWVDENMSYWYVNAAELGRDGSVVIAAGAGANSSAVFKLDGNGTFKWKTEVGYRPGGLAMMDDGSVVVTGTLEDDGSEDFAATKLGANGTVLWKWQNGTSERDIFEAAALSDSDSVIFAGYTRGNWSRIRQNDDWDLAAVKLDAKGTEVWRWQDGSEEDDRVMAAAASGNGTVVLAGWTFGVWNGTSRGSYDFITVKLDADGTILWRWQDGSEEADAINGATVCDNATVFLGGRTKGEWATSNAGGNDFAGVQLNLTDGTELWRWQNGTEEDDEIQAVAGGCEDLVIVAGCTDGSWGQANLGEADFLAVMLDTTILPPSDHLNTPAPVSSTTSSSPYLPSASPYMFETFSPTSASLTSTYAFRALSQSSHPSTSPSMSPTPPPTSSASLSSISTTGIVVISLVVFLVLLGIVILVLLRQRWKLESEKATKTNQTREISEWHHLDLSYRPASNSATSLPLHQHEGARASRSFSPTATKPDVVNDRQNSGHPELFRAKYHHASLLSREAREAARRNNNNA